MHFYVFAIQNAIIMILGQKPETTLFHTQVQKVHREEVLMKRFKRLLFLVTLIFALAAPASIPVISSTQIVSAAVKINSSKATLVKGKTKQLKIQGTSKKVVWTSSKKSVATVNSKGKVTAKKAGTAIISAKVKGKTYKCKITVKNPVKKKVVKTSPSVWVTEKGKKYHSSRYCSRMKYPYQIPLNTARQRGYTACKKCY